MPGRAAACYHLGCVKPVVYLVRDLLFVSKIREAAAGLGVPVAVARDVVVLPALARDARLVIVDLRLAEAREALAALARDPEAARTPSIGFADHERTDLMQEATSLGLGQALAKGVFARELPALIARAPAG